MNRDHFAGARLLQFSANVFWGSGHNRKLRFAVTETFEMTLMVFERFQTHDHPKHPKQSENT